ncbi:MAG: hypothetical protein ACI9YH_000142 [Colwellia sp.]|jgi:hypothetical protein
MNSMVKIIKKNEPDLPHLPQIIHYFEGYIYPFIGKANLAQLIEMRKSKINNDNFWSYNSDAKADYFSHLSCIEQCIRILMNVPNPRYSIIRLSYKKQKKIYEEIKVQRRVSHFLKNCTDEEKLKLKKMYLQLFKR